MNYEVLTMTLKFQENRGVYSILSNTSGSLFMWVMEREWKHNQRSASCVPRDEYVFERHHGTKYPDTFALVGDGVGHLKSEGKPRFACCLHSAVFPTDLEGCLSGALSIGAAGNANGSEEATQALRAYLDQHTTEDRRVKVLMQGAF